jgi:hypothetical protein
MNEADDHQHSLLARIRRLLNTREIPNVISTTSADAHACDACGEAIRLGRPQFEIGFSRLMFRLDALCFRIWTEEMLRKHPSPKPRKSALR